MLPAVQEFAKANAANVRVRVASVEGDRTLYQRYGFTSVPTTILIRDFRDHRTAHRRLVLRKPNRLVHRGTRSPPREFNPPLERSHTHHNVMRRFEVASFHTEGWVSMEQLFHAYPAGVVKACHDKLRTKALFQIRTLIRASRAAVIRLPKCGNRRLRESAQRSGCVLPAA